MARELSVQFDHAVYDTFLHQHGATLTVDSTKLGDLLMAADSALDREAGFFFDTIDGQFVVGFERKREDAHGKSRGMAYFDLFVTPVSNVEEVPLVGLRESLETAVVQNFETPPDNQQVQFRYNLRPRSGRAQGSQDSTQAGGSSQSKRQVNPTFIAETWELYRRDSMQPYLSLAELDSLIEEIDGLLPEISFVSSFSDDDIESDYFEIIDGAKPHPDIEISELRQRVKTLQRQGRLTYANLPTYQDALNTKRTEQKEAIGRTELNQDIEHIFNDAQNKVKTRLQNYPSQGKKLFEQAFDGELVEGDDEVAADAADPGAVLYGGLVLAVLAVGFVVGGVAAPLAGFVDAPTLVGSLVLGTVGALLIGLGVHQFGLITTADNLDWNQVVIDAGIFAAATLSVMLLTTQTIPTDGVKAVAVPVLPLKLSVVGFAGTVFGLLAGYGAVVYTHRQGTQGAAGPTPLMDDPQTDVVDDDTIAAIDEAFQAESDAVAQWIDDQLIEDIRDELQRAAKQHAKESAERTVDGIRTVKQSQAYKEASESETPN